MNNNIKMRERERENNTLTHLFTRLSKKKTTKNQVFISNFETNISLSLY